MGQTDSEGGEGLVLQVKEAKTAGPTDVDSTCIHFAIFIVCNLKVIEWNVYKMFYRRGKEGIVKDLAFNSEKTTNNIWAGDNLKTLNKC